MDKSIIEMPSNTEFTTTLAPVVIPTLCRYNHFRKCIESLMKCIGAQETEVYVGLDFPSKPSHKEGYQKICEYLTTLKDNHNFKSIHIIKRQINFGTGPDGNAEDLIKLVLKNHDAYIFSEDDNIFSPAFLVYINKGLNKFKNDKSVIGINGYRHFYSTKFKNNSFYRQNVDFSGWGCGMWKDRTIVADAIKTSKYWRLKALCPWAWWRCYNNGWNRVLNFIRLIRNAEGLTDNAYSVYMAVNKKDVVMPKISLVRNMGWDGSGEHCNNESILFKAHNGQIIDTSSIFDFIGTGMEYYKYNHNIHVTQSYKRLTFMDFCARIYKKLINNK